MVFSCGGFGFRHGGTPQSSRCTTALSSARRVCGDTSGSSSPLLKMLLAASLKVSKSTSCPLVFDLAKPNLELKGMNFDLS